MCDSLLIFLFSSCHCFFLGFTDSLSSSIHFVFLLLVVEGWPGWKGGNTKNRVGKGDKVLILGDYLGSQKVGEGGELCPFHEVGKMGA